MQGYINIGREDWVKSEYGFDLPCVTILIPRRIGLEYLRDVREPNDVCRVITALIEDRFPILKGCVVCSFSLDPMQQMWSCYVVHNSLKRVSLGYTAPIVRMTQENKQIIPMYGECYELPIRDDYMQPKIIITDNKGPKFEERKSPYESEEMTEPGEPYISNTE